MEGFVLDSFEKNDMLIDRAYNTFLKSMQQKIGQDNLIDVQLCIYSKTQDNKKIFRMFVACGDCAAKLVFLADATVKQIDDQNFVIDSCKEIDPLPFNGLPKMMFTNFEQNFPGEAECEEFLVNPRVKEQFYMVRKESGDISVCIKKEGSNELEEYYSFTF